MVSGHGQSIEVASWFAYGLRDIIDNDGAVGITIIHGGQRFVSLLTGGIPYFELDCRVFIEGYRLGEESGSDCRFTVVIELVLDKAED